METEKTDRADLGGIAEDVFACWWDIKLREGKKQLAQDLAKATPRWHPEQPPLLGAAQHGPPLARSRRRPGEEGKLVWTCRAGVLLTPRQPA